MNIICSHDLDTLLSLRVQKALWKEEITSELKWQILRYFLSVFTSTSMEWQVHWILYVASHMGQRSIICLAYICKEPCLFSSLLAYLLPLSGPTQVLFYSHWVKMLISQKQLEYILLAWSQLSLPMALSIVSSDSYKLRISSFHWWYALELQLYFTSLFAGFWYSNPGLGIEELPLQIQSLIGSICCWLALYMKLSPSCTKTWTGFSKEALHNIPTFLEVAFPSAIMVW